MRGTWATGCGLLIGALVVAVLMVVALYAWDSGARTAEAALRPPPAAPLAVAPPTRAPAVAVPSPAASPAAARGPLTAGDAGAGREVFAAQCTSCHPGAGAGIGPALYGPQFAERYPEDGPLVAVIRQGKGGMPGFAPDQFTEQDLADTMAYLRGLASGAIEPEPTPTPRPRQRGG